MHTPGWVCIVFEYRYTCNLFLSVFCRFRFDCSYHFVCTPVSVWRHCIISVHYILAFQFIWKQIAIFFFFFVIVVHFPDFIVIYTTHWWMVVLCTWTIDYYVRMCGCSTPGDRVFTIDNHNGQWLKSFHSWCQWCYSMWCLSHAISVKHANTTHQS